MALHTQSRQRFAVRSFVRAAVALCASFALSFASANVALADEASDLKEKADQAAAENAEAQAKVSELQMRVAETAEVYNEAQARVDELQGQIDEAQARIDELEREIPDQQNRCAQSVKTLYIMQEEGFGLIQTILSSETLDDFLTSYEYVDCINTHNNAQLEKLQSMMDELDEKQDQLKSDTEQAREEAQRAEEAMEQAQAAREKASAEAAKKAKAEAEASAAAEFAEREKAAKEAAEKEGVDAGNTAAEQPASNEVEEVTKTVSLDDVSWSENKTTFVDQWTSRIDNYLAGTPMAGQGKTFAAAAWDYGVDPRWSPAIATVESSKGTYCFKPYNAWGWGSYSFDSWEEAIPKHVAYLGSMYGSTISREAASIYCPPNASFWYNRCVEEMDRI